jgi:hypothetical protein
MPDTPITHENAPAAHAVDVDGSLDDERGDEIPQDSAGTGEEVTGFAAPGQAFDDAAADAD